MVRDISVHKLGDKDTKLGNDKDAKKILFENYFCRKREL